MTITVRQAKCNDAELIAQLNRHVQQIHASAMPHLYKPPLASVELVEHYREVLSEGNHAVYIAEFEGVPAGYMGCVIQIRPENPFTFEQRILSIDEISVNPEYKRRGCASRLMRAALALAQEQNLTRITLGVLAFNDEAQQFYRKQGFTIYSHQMHLLLSGL